MVDDDTSYESLHSSHAISDLQAQKFIANYALQITPAFLSTRSIMDFYHSIDIYFEPESSNTGDVVKKIGEIHKIYGLSEEKTYNSMTVIGEALENIVKHAPKVPYNKSVLLQILLFSHQHIITLCYQDSGIDIAKARNAIASYDVALNSRDLSIIKKTHGRGLKMERDLTDAFMLCNIGWIYIVFSQVLDKPIMHTGQPRQTYIN